MKMEMPLWCRRLVTFEHYGEKVTVANCKYYHLRCYAEHKAPRQRRGALCS